MAKVRFFDKRILKSFIQAISVVSTALSLVLIFVEIPKECKPWAAGAFVLLLIVVYFVLWRISNNLEEINIDVDGSAVTITTGDIFEQPGLKVVAFNEYFDTQVDDKIISSQSLNGQFVNKYFPASTADLDDYIDKYAFEKEEFLEVNAKRKAGKKKKYSIGTICVYKEYIFAAFAKFDENNMAWLTMPEYLSFLVNFWDKVNKVYAQKSVSVPIFGSGITRIREHKSIGDEELLKIMLWTFRISEMRFKYPAKLTIVIHRAKIDKVNLLDIKSAKNGI